MSTSTHTLPELGQEDMSREFSLAYSNVVKYMQGERLPVHPTPRPQLLRARGPHRLPQAALTGRARPPQGRA